MTYRAQGCMTAVGSVAAAQGFMLPTPVSSDPLGRVLRGGDSVRFVMFNGRVCGLRGFVSVICSWRWVL